jgi:hypothetical protein
MEEESPFAFASPLHSPSFASPFLTFFHSKLRTSSHSSPLGNPAFGWTKQRITRHTHYYCTFSCRWFFCMLLNVCAASINCCGCYYSCMLTLLLRLLPTILLYVTTAATLHVCVRLLAMHHYLMLLAVTIASCVHAFANTSIVDVATLASS